MSGTTNRIDMRFAKLRREGKKALIPYLVAGDPDLSFTLQAMHCLVENGASVIELGMPFSDPEAEGPVIQRGHERALAAGMALPQCLELVRQFRQLDGTTPVVLMGYLNPIERVGAARFAQAAAAAGADGALLVNLPPQESQELQSELDRVGMRLIFLISPTTTFSRAKMIVEHGGGFLYYVSLKGITGADHFSVSSVRQYLEQLRPLTQLPIAVGFGIKTPASARAVAEIADAVVVGAAVVDLIAGAAANPQIALQQVAALMRSFRSAMDGQST